MTDLESRIRELSLREPGDVLDQRVLSTLQSVGHPETNRSSALLNEPSQLRRGMFSITISGIVAALLIGVAIGNSLPSFWSRPEQSAAGTSDWTSLHGSPISSGAFDSAVPDEEVRTGQGHPMIPDLPAHIREALKDRATQGSQFVESVRESALAGAAVWERENGELFNIATHVRDRRFDMCRECHRVGG